MKGLPLWKRAYALAVAVAAAFTPLIYQPPGHALQGSPLDWKLLATIAIAFIILARARWFARNSRPVTTIGAFALGVVLLVTYFYLSQLWSCEVGQGRVVIGASLKPDAAAVLAKTPSATCTQLLLNFASDPRLVYEESAIYFRETVLGVLYFAMIVVFAAGLLGLIRGRNASTP